MPQHNLCVNTGNPHYIVGASRKRAMRHYPIVVVNIRIFLVRPWGTASQVPSSAGVLTETIPGLTEGEMPVFRPQQDLSPGLSSVHRRHAVCVLHK